MCKLDLKTDCKRHSIDWSHGRKNRLAEDGIIRKGQPVRFRDVATTRTTAMFMKN